MNNKQFWISAQNFMFSKPGSHLRSKSRSEINIRTLNLNLHAYLAWFCFCFINGFRKPQLTLKRIPRVSQWCLSFEVPHVQLKRPLHQTLTFRPFSFGYCQKRKNKKQRLSCIVCCGLNTKKTCENVKTEIGFNLKKNTIV